MPDLLLTPEMLDGLVLDATVLSCHFGTLETCNKGGLEEVSRYRALHKALTEFQNHWDDTRKKTIDALDDLKQVMVDVRATFEELDAGLDAALAGEDGAG
jgi:hypothetical protein